jgi:hypothetical protein
LANRQFPTPAQINVDPDHNLQDSMQSTGSLLPTEFQLVVLEVCPKHTLLLGRRAATTGDVSVSPYPLSNVIPIACHHKQHFLLSWKMMKSQFVIL